MQKGIELIGGPLNGRFVKDDERTQYHIVENIATSPTQSMHPIELDNKIVASLPHIQIQSTVLVYERKSVDMAFNSNGMVIGLHPKDCYVFVQAKTWNCIWDRSNMVEARS